ncbi:hypothetical protein PVK06_036715 [Gossypium arboreum]|uniref:Uncharacterized protein n=1 Tax=Gossypium arboreum TaxID=29729 RepID=A0ABR0NKB5_GOSAR|nr:hypothetical protein PVK06_036715 [Gossypium arboreum]
MNRLLNEANKIMDQMEFLTAQNKKLLATDAAQSKYLESRAENAEQKVIKIQKTLGPFDSTGINFDRAKISKEEELQNRIIQLERELSRKQALDSGS